MVNNSIYTALLLCTFFSIPCCTAKHHLLKETKKSQQEIVAGTSAIVVDTDCAIAAVSHSTLHIEVHFRSKSKEKCRLAAVAFGNRFSSSPNEYLTIVDSTGMPVVARPSSWIGKPKIAETPDISEKNSFCNILFSEVDISTGNSTEISSVCIKKLSNDNIIHFSSSFGIVYNINKQCADVINNPR